jgi:hypothetical protein
MKTIGISAPLKSPALRRMLDALGEVLDLRFEERMFGDDTGIDAWIFHEPERENLRRIAMCEHPCYTVIRFDQVVPCGESSTIEFSRHNVLPTVLIGKRIRSDEAVNVMALPRWLEIVTVLACKEGSPVWAMQEVDGQQHHYVTSQIPELSDGESLFQYFHRGQFLHLLPLILFLRTLAEDQRWEQPPLRACFMFDDPNLHWRTYGFLDFAKIADHAQMHNYHTSFATIPLDTWFIHKPTAALFKRYPDRLSLLIHGNDHVADELARPYSDEELSVILREALRRIDKFERSSGVEVSRVMAPPHGACSERTLNEMAHLGFEAASISRGSLRHHNRQATWVGTLGMKPSEIIRGLPVFPRFPLSGSCQNSILIAALLRQPIIAAGHHHDVAEGLQLLADLAGYINSLGTVHWSNMKRISRSHFARRLEGKILRVKMYAKHIEVCVPEGVNQILSESPWPKEVASMPLVWKLLSEGSEWKTHPPAELIPVRPGQKIEIVAELPTLPPIDARNIGKLRLWPIVRRQLTETRDRLAPVLKNVRLFRSSVMKHKQ